MRFSIFPPSEVFVKYGLRYSMLLRPNRFLLSFPSLRVRVCVLVCVCTGTTHVCVRVCVHVRASHVCRAGLPPSTSLVSDSVHPENGNCEKPYSKSRCVHQRSVDSARDATRTPTPWRASLWPSRPPRHRRPMAMLRSMTDPGLIRALARGSPV